MGRGVEGEGEESRRGKEGEGRKERRGGKGGGREEARRREKENAICSNSGQLQIVTFFWQF